MSARTTVLAHGARLAGRVRTLEEQLLTVPLAPYGVAVSRMLAGLAYVGILLTNFGQRDLLFGPASGWIEPQRDASPQGGWTGLVAGMSEPFFTLFYLAVVAVGLAFVVGWHGRTSGFLLLVCAVQIIEMNPLVGDQGDNIVRIGLFFTLLTDHSAVWSFDARRRRGRPARTWPEWTGTAKVLLHNAAVVALAIQVVIVYIVAGMYKVSGGSWKYGTAIAYPLQLDEYRVWPFLNDLAVVSSVGVFLGTYGAILLQLYFPALLLNRVTRRIALVLVLLLHLGIAVMMALPWFSLAMVAFDGIFVSTATYLALERWLAPRWQRLRGSVRRRLVRP